MCICLLSYNEKNIRTAVASIDNELWKLKKWSTCRAPNVIVALMNFNKKHQTLCVFAPFKYPVYKTEGVVLYWNNYITNLTRVKLPKGFS